MGGDEHLRTQLANIANLRIYSTELTGMGIPRDRNCVVQTADERNALAILDLSNPEIRRIYDELRAYISS